MRKFLGFTFAVVLLLSLGSCGGKKETKVPTTDEILQEVSRLDMTMTAQDSAEVFSLVNLYLDKLRAGKFDEAVGMLYYLNGDKIESLHPTTAATELSVLNRCKGVKYDLVRITYKSEYDNIAKYTVTLFDKEQGDPRPNTISFVMKPVRVEGKWYLTMADRTTESHDFNGTEIPN